MWRNSASAWGLGARLFHWIGAALIAVLIAHGWWMTHQVPRAERLANYGWHADLGYVLLALLLVRLVWRLINPTPALPATASAAERLAAHAAHWGLYALMLASAVAGWGLAGTFRNPIGMLQPPAIVTDRGLHEALEVWHGRLSWALLAVVVIHIVAALWHHFIRRDDILTRMSRGAPRAG
jgi:cytochrome b561